MSICRTIIAISCLGSACVLAGCGTAPFTSDGSLRSEEFFSAGMDDFGGNRPLVVEANETTSQATTMSLPGDLLEEAADDAVMVLSAADITVTVNGELSGRTNPTAKATEHHARITIHFAPPGKDACDSNDEVGPFELTFEDGVVTLAEDSLPLDTNARSTVRNGKFEACSEIWADFDGSISIDNVTFEFGRKPHNAEQVTICHIPPGNPDNEHTIAVGAPTVDAHLAHGDYIGECERPDDDSRDEDGDGDGVFDEDDECPDTAPGSEVDADGCSCEQLQNCCYESVEVKHTFSVWIDGIDRLLIQGETVQWHHLKWAAPGRGWGSDRPTLIDGVEWYPEWPEPVPAEIRYNAFSSVYESFSPGLPAEAISVDLVNVDIRHSVWIVQQPTEANDYTLEVELNDGPPPGQYYYEIALAWPVLTKIDCNPDRDDEDGDGVFDDDDECPDTAPRSEVDVDGCSCSQLDGDADCDDLVFCNGQETCVDGACAAGDDPCPGQSCDEVNGECVGAPEPRMESGTVVAGGRYVTVLLANTYVSPVVVCSVQYNNNTTPIVARVSSVTATSFAVRLQNPSGGAVVADNVHYLVVEEGTWTIDGVNIEAQTYLSTVTDENNSWVGEAQDYGQSYTNPVVVGQVMSENDPDWSVFWCRGASSSDPPSASSLNTGKHVAEDTYTTRADETVGFVVFEGGHGTIGGVAFEAWLGTDTVQGAVDSPPYAYTFKTAFASAPTVGIATIAGMDGTDGGWSQIHGATLATTMLVNLSIDEDQIGDAERNRTTDQVGYVVFETAVVYPAAPPCNVPADCDDDNDGVTNDADRCPNTPAGETVDANGCGCSQLDADADGVDDCDDLCPETSSGESVDVDGCSTSPLTVTATVPGPTDIYLAGQPDGATATWPITGETTVAPEHSPVSIDVSGATGMKLRLFATGVVNTGGNNGSGPDGRSWTLRPGGMTQVYGLTRMRGFNAGALVGVFLTDDLPTVGLVPYMSGSGIATPTPLLQHIFVIGSSREVAIPERATRLFFGVAEQQGCPWDNSGEYEVSVETVAGDTLPPDPLVATRFYTGDPNDPKDGIGWFDAGEWAFDFDFDGVADYTTTFGQAGDLPVVGDFNGDGLDEIGVMTPSDAGNMWMLDTNGSGVYDAGDESFTYGADAGSIPMAGDWDGDGVFELGFITPDELWHFDLDGDRIDDPSEAEDTQFGQSQNALSTLFVIGDWTGDGISNLAHAISGSFGWRFDLNNDRRWVWGTTHPDQWWRWGNPTVHIGVVGDWDGDRLDDPCVFRTDSGLWQFTNRVEQGGSIAPSVEGFGANKTPVAGSWALIRASDRN